jgi:zinc protease
MRKLTFLITILLLTQWENGLANAFKTEHWSTANGVKVAFYQAIEVPMLDISLAFAAGSVYDQERYGLSALTAQMLSEGSLGIDANKLADSLADTGAQFGTETSRDMVVFNLRTLTSKDTLNQATEIFTKMINHPDFPNDALEREKQQFLMAIEQTKDSPDELATQLFFKNLYQNHPYAHPVNGTENTIKNISRQDLLQFYKQRYLANNAVLVLVGAIDRQTAHQLADKLTHELPQGLPLEPIAKALPLKQEQAIKTPFPSSQTLVRLGQSGIDYQNPDYFPLMVGNYILGGGSLVSELAMEVRGKRGLTYTIDSQFVPMPGIGPFLISFSTKNKQAKEAIQLTDETLKRFVKEGPSQQELEEAKNYLTGSFPLSLGSNRAIATLLLRITFYHLPENYLNTYLERINKVTTENIKRAFQQTVYPNKLLLVTVGQS